MLAPMLTDILVIASLIAVAAGKIPSLRINRAGLALVGAVALVLTGSLNITDALSSIDGQTLTLLFAMMVFNANLRLSGFFRWAGSALQASARPTVLLAVVMAVSAVLSALFINDTAVVMLTPLVAETTLALSLNPIPYLIALALAANIGSMTTPIGNPQNILIATAQNLGFGEFLGALALPALLSLALAYGLIRLLYRKDFRSVKPMPGDGLMSGAPGKNLRAGTDPISEIGEMGTETRSGRRPIPVYRPLFIKCIVSFAVMAGCWIAGMPVALGALAGIAILLLTRRVRPDKIFAEVDWTLLVLFAGLFVITRAAASTASYRALMSVAADGLDGPALGWFAAGLSQIISNVPAVMVLLPALDGLGDPNRTALMLAGVTTLAGNFTLLGSVANLIMAEGAKRYGVKISFLEYFKAGAILAPLTIALTLAALYGFR